jgi:hypothetical protein
MARDCLMRAFISMVEQKCRGDQTVRSWGIGNAKMNRAPSLLADLQWCLTDQNRFKCRLLSNAA